MNLSDVPPGSIVEVVGIKGGVGFIRRLLSLSIRVGDKLKVINNTFRGPILVEHMVHGHRVALGRGMASKIEVKVL